MPMLNHINLPVADIPSSCDFFVRYFGFVPFHEPEESPMAVMRGDGGFILNIMRARRNDVGAFPKGYNVGFLFDTPPEVDAMHAQLQADSVRTGKVERMTRRGSSSVANTVLRRTKSRSR